MTQQTTPLQHVKTACALLLWGAAAALILLPSSISQAQSPRSRSSRSERNLAIHREKHTELQQQFAKELEELAADCDDKNLPDAAKQLRALAVPVNREVIRSEKLSDTVRPEIPSDLPAEERYWRTQLRFQQEKHAKELYLLSRRVLYAGSPSYAFDIVREVARHNPDHRTARRLLGYVRSGNKWITPYAAKMQRRFVWHEKFGWLLKAHVDRYEQGQRFFKGRWMTAAQEAEIRRDFRFAWEIRTDHYLVKTNHSLERGVQVATALEEYYDHFFQVFAGFFNTPEQMEKLFSGSSSRQSSLQKPYEVHYYREQSEYNERLVKKIPQIALTNGLYYTTDQTCYFFHDESEPNERTLYHEATHQLFYESSARHRQIALERDFWIVEGIACYMESFTKAAGRLTLGDPRYIRFRAARHRYLVDGYYVPLARFAGMGMQAFQSDVKVISKNYSQASGLAHFFMHFNDGRYRDALITHLSQLYHPELRTADRTASLAELTSTEFSELDRQYGEYLKTLQKGLDNLEQGKAN